MGDYCRLCAFNPRTECPIASLYWAFLARHEAKLRVNPRLRTPLAFLGKRRQGRKHKDQQVYRQVRDLLLKGEVIKPESL
jgi:deoxyribodipyrimidine photolyase-like uncharacterized protein